MSKNIKMPQKKVEKVMHEFKEGELHSGSKKGPVVTNPKQGIAIALSEAKKGKKMEEGGELDVQSRNLTDKNKQLESPSGAGMAKGGEVNLPGELSIPENWLLGTPGEGPLIRFHQNKQMKEQSHWIGSNRNGESKSWHPNGKLESHAFWLENHPIGEAKTWDENGKMLMHVFHDEVSGLPVEFPKNTQSGHILANEKHYPHHGWASNKAVEDETHQEEKERALQEEVVNKLEDNQNLTEGYPESNCKGGEYIVEKDKVTKK